MLELFFKRRAKLDIKIRSNISAIVAEYESKKKQIINDYSQATEHLENIKSLAIMQGEYPRIHIKTQIDSLKNYLTSLNNSTWLYAYKLYNLDRLMSPKEKDAFFMVIDSGKTPEFNVENLYSTFGKHMQDPVMAIAKSFAEVFCNLDPYYKSHEKVKVGAKGLPKRIIIKYIGGFRSSGEKQLEATLTALSCGMNLPILSYREVCDFVKPQKSTSNCKNSVKKYDDTVLNYVELKLFQNGNGHLHFKPKALETINKMLAYYYGETLPDAPEETDAPRQSTEVSKDLQYYPTPRHVAERLCERVILKNANVLDPSCGCGRLLDAAIRAGASSTFGIEYDRNRALESKKKGHSVVIRNFLEVQEPAECDKYDVVMMNPPFFGKHYFKHIEHARKFVKKGGKLVSVLPATARYDHNLIKIGQWSDLPLGSFSESGTNVNTCIYEWFNR